MQQPAAFDAQPVFRALADPTRRAIIEMLAEKPRSIGEIAARFDVTRPAIAKHLRILEEGDVIAVEAKGRERINSLSPAALKTAFDWLGYFDRFWDERLALLKDLVEDKR
ncbi:MAG: metalloregulator ArsR/SmtB family transcription factor [Pseudomonadota bacterium]|nr:metalloregulator ArsR/SmtB family transcription factor [Pseudomonadota bacterium]